MTPSAVTFNGLPTKTTETHVLYINGLGKISSGTTSGGGSGIGWSNMTNAEKDIAIKHYISDDPTNAVIYLMSKGYTQQQAQGFVLMSWHKYHFKLLEAANQRFYYLKFVVPQYLSLTDAEKLFDDASGLIYEFTALGRFGIAIGDKKSGILDYLMSTNDYVGKGMEESGLTLLQGTWDSFRSALYGILVDGIYTKY
jgi:hypothetical protein